MNMICYARYKRDGLIDNDTDRYELTVEDR